ncbi:MAG: hypothetical protein KF699_07325 [Phycisphaeraceae bacterium]|nr:hypothetical protein [Phycisphaeraceae bacterium]MBX3405166.1 hypothetical protein [Phycisphaeraceae bacterium]
MRDTPDQDPMPGEAGPGEVRVPPRLEAALRGLSACDRVFAAPAGFDDDILGMARARLRTRPVVRVLLRAGTGIAAAAALGLVAVLWWQGGGGSRGVNIAALDPARQVDIVDAFTLARRLRDGAAVDASWDVTRDGAVDEQDVERLRAMAVRLDRAGGGA